jgi:uncharacterized protein YjbJ (UPF0337 family)
MVSGGAIEPLSRSRGFSSSRQAPDPAQTRTRPRDFATARPDHDFRSIEMTDLRLKGAANKVTGNVQAGLGKMTGDRRLELKGKIKQAQGSAQQGLADFENASRQPSSR